MMSLPQILQAIVTILAVINPVVCASIFLTLTPKLGPAQRRQAAAKVALSMAIILAASALIGLQVLRIFGISLDVFRVVGGMIIAYMGFGMLRGRQTVGQASPANDDTAAPSSLGPLIMFGAGPGTITAVVTLAAVHTPDGSPVSVADAITYPHVLVFDVAWLSSYTGTDGALEAQGSIRRDVPLGCCLRPLLSWMRWALGGGQRSGRGAENDRNRKSNHRFRGHVLYLLGRAG